MLDAAIVWRVPARTILQPLQPEQSRSPETLNFEKEKEQSACATTRQLTAAIPRSKYVGGRARAGRSNDVSHCLYHRDDHPRGDMMKTSHSPSFVTHHVCGYKRALPMSSAASFFQVASDYDFLLWQVAHKKNLYIHKLQACK